MPAPVLFVSHDASRTGAPIALLTLLRYFRATSALDFEVVLRNGGELEPCFSALARVTKWPQGSLSHSADDRTWISRFHGLRSRAGHVPGPKAIAALRDEFRSRGTSLIYSNTITNGEVLDALAPLGLPVISHVHELDYWITHHISPSALASAREHTTAYIAASKAVADSLERLVGVPRTSIATVYESIELCDEAPDARTRARLRCDVPSDVFVVGFCGTMDWRKGIDLLAPLAREVERHSLGRPVHWMWVGGEREGMTAGKVLHDFERIGSRDRLHLTGELHSARELFAAFDVFVVLSREDAFPLVMLEAASASVPILCFSGAGGAPEFVRDDAGFVVPYLDIGRMASRIVELVHAPHLIERFGLAARARVVAEHDVRVVAPTVLERIQQLSSQSR